MEKFPKLVDGQVVLCRAEFNTGHVLDEEFHLAIRNNQKVYTIFNDFNSALLEAETIVKERPSVECAIYNETNTLLKYVTPQA